jgi:hypothetical protein
VIFEYYFLLNGLKLNTIAHYNKHDWFYRQCSVNSDRFDNNVATIFVSAPNVKIQDLIAEIIHLHSNMKFAVINSSSNGATLALK